MMEVKVSQKDERALFYVPEKCIGCGTCVLACPKDAIVIGSVGAVARGEIDKDFVEFTEECITCGMCARVCPTGALVWKTEDEKKVDTVSGSLKTTSVSDKCVLCGLCEAVCPQGCIEVERWFANDGSASVDGNVKIEQEFCIHCGWCASVCPVDAIEVDKPFEGEWSWNESLCQACRTCVDVCPCNALFNPDWGPGEVVEKIRHRVEVCIYCGACAVACPVKAIEVKKTKILVDMDKKAPLEKRILDVPAPEPSRTSILKTNEDVCLGCNSCVVVCPVNASSDPFLAAGHLNDTERKPLLDVQNGVIAVVDQELCGSCGTCSMICPVNAIWLERREEVMHEEKEKPEIKVRV
jgi:4Fe-4S ferredoxin